MGELSIGSRKDAVLDNKLHLCGGTTLLITSNALVVCDPESKNRSPFKFCGFGASRSGSSLNIPVYNILWVEVLESRLEIIYASSSNEDVQPTSLRYRVDVDLESINKWVSLLLHHAYRDSQRRRRAKVLINPVSGRGLARGLFSEHIEPILKAARWVTEVVETKGKGDGEKILLEMDITSFDLVVVCSGDGLAHEVFNGLGKRSDATLALSRMPIAHLPCGSGNGLSYNLNQTKNVSKATLSMIKSVTRPLDLISITQGDRRSLSFLSQGAGSAAESDIATEPLRWMGEIRFALGFLWCIAAKKTYPADFAVKIAVESNSAILKHDEEYYAMDNGVDGKSGSGAGSETYPAGDLKVQHGLPLLKYGTINDKIPDDWTIISREDLGLFYCGNLPNISADAKFFPRALPNDGMMDLMFLDGNLDRFRAVQTLIGINKGWYFDSPEVQYRKVLAYRWTPRDQGSAWLSVDGESFPYEPFQAEIHQSLGRVMIRNMRIPGAADI